MAIKKTDFATIKKKYSQEATFKPERYFDLGDAFLDACGIPGPAMGHINMFLGHSDTGKSTALILSAIDAQKKGILPVFIITEQKWSFNHAKVMGLECEEVIDEKTGAIEWDGFFFFNNNFQYVEQITDYINSLINAQEKGEINYDLLFLWDSIGSVPSKMTFENKGGKMQTAGVLSEKIGMGLNQRITGSRMFEKPHTNTMIIVTQPWVKLPDNPFGQPKIMPKGGESVYLNSTYVFLFGNQKDSGITKISITKNGRKVKIATRTKISVMKNHMNGLGYEDGKILVTTHGFMRGRSDSDEKKSLEEYKKLIGEYISEKLGINISEIDNVNVISEDED